MTQRDAAPSGEAGPPDDLTYGTHLEQPLDGSSALAQSTPDPDGTAPGRPPAEAAGQEKAPASEGNGGTKPPADEAAADAGPSERDGTSEAPPAKKDEAPPPAPRKTLFVLAGLVLVGLLGWGAYGHWSANREAAKTQDDTRSAIPEVRTTEAQRDDNPTDLTLPGQTEAFATANIFARATGYITERRVDIGSRVRKGDLLVHITAPDTDQQLAQATAQLGQVKAAEAQAHAQVAQAEANLNLAKVTLARTAALTQQGYETLQNRDNQVANQQSQQANVDTAQAGVKVAEANTKAQQATVDRLAALAGFENVKAPFDGVVTTRNVDTGDLVNADTSSATPMFSIARDDIIRVTVAVPQNSSSGIRDGITASVEVPSTPGQGFSGTVTRSSVALLSSARTLDTEVDVKNPDGRIRPGLFVYVTLHIPRTHPEIVVPAEALIFDQKGMQVAVAEGDQAKIHKVKIDRDFGTTVSLSEGLQGGEQVILSPPALLRDGSKIKARKAEEPDKTDGSQAKPDQPGKKDPKDTDPAASNAAKRPGQHQG